MTAIRKSAKNQLLGVCVDRTTPERQTGSYLHENHPKIEKRPLGVVVFS